MIDAFCSDGLNCRRNIRSQAEVLQPKVVMREVGERNRQGGVDHSDPARLLTLCGVWIEDSRHPTDFHGRFSTWILEQCQVAAHPEVQKVELPDKRPEVEALIEAADADVDADAATGMTAALEDVAVEATAVVFEVVAD